MGASLALLSFAKIGSSLAVRTFSRLGSSFAILGLAHLGSALSIVDFVGLGSSLSLRSFCRLGSSLSVLSYASLGSTLSVRSYVGVGKVIQLNGQGLIQDVEYFPTSFGTEQPTPPPTPFDPMNPPTQAPTYDPGYTGGSYNEGAMEFSYGGSTKSMAITSTGGSLHGTWTSEDTIGTSDKRLKKDISPLELRLTSSEKPGEESPLWVLRQMRPVSFQFKDNAQGKNAQGKKPTRFGFVADELEQVIPDVVRHVKETDPAKQEMLGSDHFKGVAYQDLIALLTAVAKSQQLASEQLAERVLQLEQQNAVAAERVLQLEQKNARPDDLEARVMKRVEDLMEQKIARLSEAFAGGQVGHENAGEARQDLRNEIGRGLRCLGLQISGKPCEGTEAVV